MLRDLDIFLAEHLINDRGRTSQRLISEIDRRDRL